VHPLFFSFFFINFFHFGRSCYSKAYGHYLNPYSPLPGLGTTGFMKSPSAQAPTSAGYPPSLDFGASHPSQHADPRAHAPNQNPSPQRNQSTSHNPYHNKRKPQNPNISLLPSHRYKGRRTKQKKHPHTRPSTLPSFPSYRSNRNTSESPHTRWGGPVPF